MVKNLILINVSLSVVDMQLISSLKEKVKKFIVFISMGGKELINRDYVLWTIGKLCVLAILVINTNAMRKA